MRRTLLSATASLFLLLAAARAHAQESSALLANTKIQKDITYATTPNGPVKLDLYLPASAFHPMPVVLHLSAHRESPERPASELLGKGYALIYAAYLPDTAPHSTIFNSFPADLQTAKAAIRWAHGSASTQNFNPDKIALWATGNAATLAALVAVTPDQSDLNGSLGDFPNASNSIHAVCLFGGTTDFRNAELFGDETVNFPNSPAYQLFNGNTKEHPDLSRDASAVNYIRPTSPATLMVTLASDSNRAMHLIFAETLRRAGVASALYEEPAGSSATLEGHAVDEDKLNQTILVFFNDTLNNASASPASTLTPEQEIHQLASAGLYKQARRLTEQQLAASPPASHNKWLSLIRQLADQQRTPALTQLTAYMKQSRKDAADASRSPAAKILWTIREILTDPDHIGEYQVEANPSQAAYDSKANALHQVELLNAAILQKNWPAADQQANSMRASSPTTDRFILNEFLIRYNQLRANPNQSTPPGIQTPPFAIAFGQDLYGYWFDLRAGGAVQRFRYISPGTFNRGSNPNEWGRLPGEPVPTPTTIKEGFWLSDSPINQEMYEGVMGRTENHSKFRGPKFPADSVSYAHAINFAAKLGVDARLPSSEEWEYAGRAGTAAPYAGTGRLSDMAWFWDEAKSNAINDNIRILNELETDRSTINRSTHEVKQKLPNAWGLYDMQGNVWQWCSGTSSEKPRDYHPLRGGSWISIPQSCRAARELWLPVEQEAWNIGLRVVVSAQQ